MIISRNNNYLNPNLVYEQGLTQADVDMILDIHDEKDEIMSYLLFAPSFPKWKVKEFMLELEDLEFTAQKLWKFSQDKTKHLWYMDLEHCSCEKSLEFFGKERPINPECCLHGNLG